jgi:hypothetical protein
MSPWGFPAKNVHISLFNGDLAKDEWSSSHPLVLNTLNGPKYVQIPY